MIKTIIRSAIAIGVAIFAGRQAIFAGRDLARYNAMRGMSGDPPLGTITNKKAPTNAEARTTNPLVMLMSIPSDLVRYLKMKSM
jgi:hypothetical protein